jgi:two-component system chemotaxis sensor kinase CheA
VSTDPYKYFRVEARELVEQLGQGVIELDREHPAEEVVPRLLRVAHTIKGAARVVKQREIADLAHKIEDHLAPFREGSGSVPRETLDAILALLDEIGERVVALTPPPDPTAYPAADEQFRTLRTDVAEMDTLLDGIAATQTRLGSLRRTVASMEQARRLASLVGEQMGWLQALSGPRSADGSPAESAIEDLRSVVDHLERDLTSDVERLQRELQLVRSAGEHLRLMPVGTLFSSLERAVRDAARALGKRAAFRGKGAEIRLDGHVLGALQPALVQIVRNAVAHGVELEAERAAAGKPAEGSVVVEAAQRGTEVAFVCRDDGRGIDLVGVQRALQRKGLVSGDQGAEGLVRMLLAGGISTSTAVTESSGRGIGLDVVREVTSRLGGHVGAQTQPGKGTTIEIVVPVSRSSLEALVVEAAGATAAIPMDAIRRTVRLDRSDVARSGGGESILFEGSLIPFLSLAQVLRRTRVAQGSRRAWSAVVLAGSAGLAAVGADRLHGRATLLLRALPALAPVDPVVGGISLDAEGNPQPVLDPDRLIDAARHDERSPATAPVAPPPIMVVDDSLTTRMLLRSILESAGYAVELASSGEEALEKAQQDRFSLFLVDVEMPGMNGFALLEHLRSDPALRAVPAVLVTSRNAPEDRSRGTQAGARAYIVKSEFDQVELLERIRNLVG